MLNAMPMPTAPPEISGGAMKGGVSRSGGRRHEAGRQAPDSFASTLETVHKKEAAANTTTTPPDRDETSPGAAEAETKPDEGAHSDTAAATESPVETPLTHPLMPVPSPDGKPSAKDANKGSSESLPVLTATADKMTGEPVDTLMEGTARPQPKANTQGGPRPSIVVVAGQTDEGAKAGSGVETISSKAMNRAVTSDEATQIAKRVGEANTPPFAGNKATAEASSVQSDPERQATPAPRPAVAGTAASQNDGEGSGPSGKSEIETGKRFANDLNEQIRPLKHQDGNRQGPESENPSSGGNKLEGQERTARSFASADTGAGVAKPSTDNGQDAFAKMTAPEDSGPMSGRPSSTDPAMPFTTATAGGKGAPVTPSAMAQSTPAATETFQPDNFNNLVEKALFTVRGGQSEARIALKPEQLGHVQMKIITENHIVTVKIVTESPVARDLIDANANQLRAELQQQGLNVESIEVSVSDDQRDAYRGARQRETFMRHMASNGKPSQEKEAPGPWEQRPGPRKANTSGAAGIDYFA